MDKAEEYRRKANDCRRMAATWAMDEHKTAWLDLADGWQQLAGATPGSERRTQELAPAGSDSLH